MDLQKITVGKCPVCGSDVVKTLKGYACVNSLENDPTCSFMLYNSFGGRRMTDAEIMELLDKKEILLDGFVTKESKAYTSLMNLNQDGSVNLHYDVGACPRCGADMKVGAKSIYCSNWNNPINACKFTIWRNSFGHDFSLLEIQELLTKGQTSRLVNTYDALGNVTHSRFGLNERKEVTKIDTTSI